MHVVMDVTVAAWGLSEGTHVASQFFAGYALEFSLSLDNVFVWALIFTAYEIPDRLRHRVLRAGTYSSRS